MRIDQRIEGLPAPFASCPPVIDNLRAEQAFDPAGLTEEERWHAKAIVLGMTLPEIIAETYQSESTAKQRRGDLREKFGARDVQGNAQMTYIGINSEVVPLGELDPEGKMWERPVTGTLTAAERVALSMAALGFTVPGTASVLGKGQATVKKQLENVRFTAGGVSRIGQAVVWAFLSELWVPTGPPSADGATG